MTSMSEVGNFEAATPGEGGGSSSEHVSEQAKERFAQSQQQAKQQSKDEKKAKKRDDRVADTIRTFMSDPKYDHLYQLISRLVARDCPSIFILSLLSLIYTPALEAVKEFIAEKDVIIENPEEALTTSNGLPREVQMRIVEWTTRMELVMNIDAVRILSKLMIDEGNMDGSVLQLTTFILVDFFENIGRDVSYEELQPLTIKILQDILEPHLETMAQYFERERALREGPKESDED